MTTDLDIAVDLIRNCQHGFGILIATERDGGVELHARSDGGGHMIVRWAPADGYTVLLAGSDRRAPAVVKSGPIGEPISATRMLQLAVALGYAPSDHDLCDSDDPEVITNALDEFIADSRWAVGIDR